MKQKAEAYKQYNDAAVAEMMIKVLPEIASERRAALSSIDKVSIIGGDASGVSGVSGNATKLMAQTMEAMKEATGIDICATLSAQTASSQDGPEHYDQDRAGRGINGRDVSSWPFTCKRQPLKGATEPFYTAGPVMPGTPY